MKKALALLALPLLLMFASCGATSGTVTDKTHTDGYYYFTYYPCGTNGTSMCPQMQYMPESWSLIIKQDSDGKYVGEGVNQGMYDSCPVGVRWIRPTTDDKGHCE